MSDDNGGEKRQERRIRRLPEWRCPDDNMLLFKSDGEYLETFCQLCKRAGRERLVVFDLKTGPLARKQTEVSAKETP